MDRIFLESLFVIGFLAHSFQTFVTGTFCVPPVCNCTNHTEYNVWAATCHTRDLRSDLQHSITKPRLIVALEVDSSHSFKSTEFWSQLHRFCFQFYENSSDLTRILDSKILGLHGVQTMVTLISFIRRTIVDDNTTVIPEETFANFSNLKFLEVKIKHLKIWKGNYSRKVPPLEAISFVADDIFIPPDHVLQTPTLQNISGVTWSHACANCVLLKNERHHNVTFMRKGTYDIYPQSSCRGFRYKVSSVTRTFASHGFLPMCILDDVKCFDSDVKLTPLHQCWKSANSVLYAEYILAPFIIIFNFIVFTTTLTAKTLRKVPSMVLVANLAVSDFFVGIYTLGITWSRHAMSYQRFHRVMDYFCPFLGFLWCCGQMVAALSSLLLTTERYIAIIFSMRPDVSFTSKPCMCGVLVSWIITVIVASLPFLSIGTYTSTTFCLPIQPNRGMSSFAYSAGLIALAFLLYTITLPMYAHIFVFVKKSGNQMGIKRDGKLAKKILILIISNLFFFLLPVFIGLLWVFAGKAFGNVPLSTREILVGSFTTLCFSINSFLNPLLYAFRDRRFQFVIKRRYYRVVNRNVVAIQNVSYHSGGTVRFRNSSKDKTT